MLTNSGRQRGAFAESGSTIPGHLAGAGLRDSRVSRLSARVWMRARRPGEMVEATRWLFVVLCLVSLLLSLLVPLVAVDGSMLLVAWASSVVLGVSWGAGYFRRTAPLGMDLVDAVAILAFALACPEPAVALGAVFSALWFRSLYGSARRALLRCVLYVAALSASVTLWEYVPGHTGGVEIGPMTGAFPTMFLTVIVGQHLARNLRAREQGARRDAVHLTVGSQLLGLTDAAEIGRTAWTAIEGICAATPGLRVLKVVGDGGTLRVDGATGGFAGVPATLPAAVVLMLTADGGTGGETAHGPAELDAAAGTTCGWVCVPLHDSQDQSAGGWLLLGSPGSVPTEAVLSIGNLANQVTLAMRNSEVHQGLTVQATLDNLTGLANRTSFNAEVSAVLDDESAGDTAVLFVDLDDFKDVNDVFGHGAGDELLREVAARLQRITRPQDLCARLGGDEFAVLLRDTGGATAAEIAQRMVQAVATPVLLAGAVTHVGASVGVATATSETDLEQLIHRADVAMYAAKANGKGRIQVFEPGLLQGNSSQMSFERQLAGVATNGQLVVHYQPVLSLPEARCTAVEALVRWEHPERGLLYPRDFIAVAERIGAIRDIGAHVLRRACGDAAGWRAAHPGFPLSIHVNVSALQLDNDGFIDSVVKCLSDFRLPPDELVLEITETVVSLRRWPSTGSTPSPPWASRSRSTTSGPVTQPSRRCDPCRCGS
jgi:diguanylate cyclase (GGDEF)-like protein